MTSSSLTARTATATTAQRVTPWPMWASLAGALGFAATLVLDTRAGDTDDLDYTVTVADMAGLDHHLFRIGSFVGYLSVAALIVFAALWHRRVVQRFTESDAAPVVSLGCIVSAAGLALAYGWKGALGTYLHGAAEEATYSDEGLFTYYILNDFSPFIGWLGVLVALLGLTWMAFREHLVSRVLGAVTGVISIGTLAAVAATGVPGLPFTALVGLLVTGVWLAIGRSPITRATV